MKTPALNNTYRRYRVWLALLIVFTGAALSGVTVAHAMEIKSKSNTASSDPMATMQRTTMQGGRAPENARDPHAHSGGFEYRGMAGWEETDKILFNKVVADQFEYRNSDGNGLFRWDIQGWRGGDYRKLWVKLEGEHATASKTGDLELQALYSHSIAAFWDFQVGARYDRVFDPNANANLVLLVIGFQGLAPYWFEVEPALFVSDRGDVSARVTSTYDLLLSQRLILQPRLEVNVAATEVHKFGVGKGINDVQLGLRLRYEIRREIAPYIGMSWNRNVGGTASLVRADGENPNILAFVAGLRWWF